MENRGEGSPEASGPSVSSGVTSLGLLAWGAGLPLEQALSWRLAGRSFFGVAGEGEGGSRNGQREKLGCHAAFVGASSLSQPHGGIKKGLVCPGLSLAGGCSGRV